MLKTKYVSSQKLSENELRNKGNQNKVGLLNLTKKLGNVSQACKVLGYSRDSFYRYKELYEAGGDMALREISRKKPVLKNRIEQEIEDAAISYGIEFPAHGQYRASNELKKRGVFISPSGVRSVWLRNDMATLDKRLKRLEILSAEKGVVLTEAQVSALEKAKEEKFAMGEIETHHPGYLGAQDTYYVGTIKGVGRIYQQTFIDTYSKVVQAKLYDRKNALVAADTPNDRVIPMYEASGISFLRVLTDCETEYCGARGHHEYQLYLAIEDIDHTKTKTRHPQTNGICKRFHRSIQEEFYAVAFRKKIYNALEKLQEDLDKWLNYYNKERTHIGKYCLGKTPAQTWNAGLHLAKEKMVSTLFQNVVSLSPSEEEETGSAGEQPVRNTLTDRNDQGEQNPPAIPMTISRRHVLENPY